jgi:hypothetical protein
MGMPPDAVRHFAEKHLDSAYKQLSAVQDYARKEGEEDRRAFEKFYNNLSLFSGGTIALSITYLGYLKTLSKPLVHPWLLRGGWIALFVCLLFSQLYVLINLYYGFHYREREMAEAKQKRYETELEEFPKIGLANLRTAEQLAAFSQQLKTAVAKIQSTIDKHQKRQDRYMTAWMWAGRVARASFVLGIGSLILFAVLNS